MLKVCRFNPILGKGEYIYLPLQIIAIKSETQ